MAKKEKKKEKMQVLFFSFLFFSFLFFSFSFSFLLIDSFFFL